MGEVIELLRAMPEMPSELDEVAPDCIQPWPEFRDWARATFLTFGSKFYNLDHAHLEEMSVEFLFTNVRHLKGANARIGQAETGPGTGLPWAVARHDEQLRRWFGYIPDFIITIDAVYFAQANPGQICALVEHELYHCDVVRTKMGNPKLNKFGQMKPTMRPHDIEEFAGVLWRYGPVEADHFLIKQALESEPLFRDIDLRGLCGTCK